MQLEQAVASIGGSQRNLQSHSDRGRYLLFIVGRELEGERETLHCLGFSDETREKGFLISSCGALAASKSVIIIRRWNPISVSGYSTNK